jgi:hypothetical protein
LICSSQDLLPKSANTLAIHNLSGGTDNSHWSISNLNTCFLWDIRNWERKMWDVKIISPWNKNETAMQTHTTTSIGWINVTVMMAEETAIPICVSNPRP